MGDPLVIAALGTFAAAVVSTAGVIIVAMINRGRETMKAAEESADEVAEQRLLFKDEQIQYWKSRYESCIAEISRSDTE